MNKDNEFLLWIAKRLVYKYGENKDLLTIAETILKKNDLISSTLQNNNDIIFSDLKSSVDLSTKVLNQIKTNLANLQRDLGQLKVSAVTDSFEDLDMSKLI